MKIIYKICLLLVGQLTFIFTYSQNCETSPMEGYLGNCELSVTASNDGKYVFTANKEAIKQWDFKEKTVVGDWVMEDGVQKLIDVSADNRYINYLSTLAKFSVFDTQTGKQVRIENYGVRAIYGKLNIALVLDSKHKLSAYDMGTKKAKSLGTYHSAPWTWIAEEPGRVAVFYEGVVTVFDVRTGKEIFSQDVASHDPIIGFSSDGKYIAWRNGIVNIETKKVWPASFSYSNPGGKFMFTSDSQHIFFVRNNSEFKGGWQYGLSGLQKYNVVTGQKECEFINTWTDNTLRHLQQGYQIFSGDDSHLLVFNEKSMSLTAQESFQTVTDSLNFFGNIGKGGQAKISKSEDEKTYLAALQNAMIPKFAALKPSEFNFQTGTHLYIYDHNSQSGMIMIGAYNQTAVWMMPEGKLIHSFGIDPANLKLGPSEKVTQVNMRMQRGAASADGNIVSLSNEDQGKEVSDVYKNGVLESHLPGVIITAILNDRQSIAWLSADKKLCLYDFMTKKVVNTYSTMPEYKLSPDRTKLLVRNALKIFDVQSGKVLLASKKYITDISNKYGISLDGNTLSVYDLSNDKSVPVTGWDEKKKGKRIFSDNQNIVTFTHNGPLYVFDADQMKYVSEKPVLKINETSFEDQRYFSNSQQVFVIYDQGYAGYGVEGTDSELATAYCLNVKTGEVTPYLWHPDRTAAAEISKHKQAANASAPDVTALLNTLKYFPDQYKFSYSNFEFLNLTNNSVALRYFSNMGTDKVYAIGRFCTGAGGITQVLALTIKNPGPHEQYNFSLLDLGRNGIVSNTVIATTQKVNGNVTELANLEVLKNASGYIINVTNESSSGSQAKTVNVAGGGCN